MKLPILIISPCFAAGGPYEFLGTFVAKYFFLFTLVDIQYYGRILVVGSLAPPQYFEF